MFGVSNTQKSLQSKCYTKVRNILEWHKTRNDKEAIQDCLLVRNCFGFVAVTVHGFVPLRMLCMNQTSKNEQKGAGL